MFVRQLYLVALINRFNAVKLIIWDLALTMNKIFKTTLASTIIASILMFSTTSFAKTTPSDIYLITENIKAELELFHDANISEPKVSTLHHKDRKPRHALQKARELYLKVQALRKSKGMPLNQLPQFAVKAVTPGDVGDLMSKVLSDLIALRVEYETAPAAAAILVDGKSPSDVYANSADISVSIDALDIASVVPNDAFRLAITINNDLTDMRKFKGITKPIAKITASKGKNPGQVLAKVHELFAKLQKLSSMPGNEVKGGIVAPSIPKGTITPSIVLDAQNNILADIGAIKFAVGVKTPTKIAAQPSGKTPSDVFDAASQAIAIINTML